MSHGVACKNYDPLPYRTGYEEVLGGRVDDLFVVTADNDGIVTDVNDKYLTVEYKTKPLAIIVKGNPKYINDPKISKMANYFYDDIKNRLELLGYNVEFDEGKAYASPSEKASVWIGHSMGIDRLQYAPKNIKTIALITKDNLEHLLKNVKTDEDIKKVYDQNGFDPKHYELSNEDIKNIDSLKDEIKGRKVVYELGITHGTVSGSTIPHTRITDMIKGQQFKKTNALIFNTGFFQRSELNPENVIYKAGIIANTVYLENASTIEDGCVITEEIANKLATPGTTLHGIVIDFNTVIHNLVSIGDKLEPESILCTLENFISEDLEAKDAEAIRSLTKLSANNPKAKTYGTITEIEVVYYGNIENMHPSLQKIATKYDTLRAKKVNTLGLDDAKTGRVTETIRVAGTKLLENQLAIKIYIDGEIAMSSGDKLVFANQLKSTCSRVETNSITTEKGEKIDAVFGYLSISNRIVGSAERSGLMNSIMINLSKTLGNKLKSK